MMKKHRRRLVTFLTHSSVFAATVFGVSHAHAATLGHSRVTSAQDQPLRVVVQVKDLSPTDLQSLSAKIAPPEAWEEAGLVPPVSLSSLAVRLLPASQNNVMQLVVESALMAPEKVIDILVDINTNASTQRHQVSVLQSQQPMPVNLAIGSTNESDLLVLQPLTIADSATVSAYDAAASRSSSSSRPVRADTDADGGTVTVQPGQTLSAVARQFSSDRYNDQQFMAALVNANPNAFIQNNINLLRAGATLAIPDAETVVAISPKQAGQFYKDQLQQFDEYRQRVAKGEPIQLAVAKPETESELEPIKQPESEPVKEVEVPKEIDAGTDRLLLSAQADTDAEQDQNIATAQDLAYTAERLALLEQKPVETAAEVVVPAPVPVEITPVPVPVAVSVAEEPMQIIAETPVESPAVASSSNDSKTALLAWLKAHVISVTFGLLLFLFLLVTLFLRRSRSTETEEYTEALAPGMPLVTEPTNPAELEFREFK